MASDEQKTFDKGAIVSTDSASLIALAAEVAKHDDKYKRVKGGDFRRPRSVKKPTVWQRQNPGLAKRAKKDQKSRDDDPQGEATRKTMMERKAKIYEMLERGEDVPDALRNELLVEFEYKNQPSRYRDDSESDFSDEDDYEDDRDRRNREQGLDMGRFRGRTREGWGGEDSTARRSLGNDRDRDESRAIAKDPKTFESDPWVEHEDEFGRTRLVRQSEIPKPRPPPERYEAPGIHNPANPFPVYMNQDSIDKQEWIKDATGEMSRSSNRRQEGPVHYDNTTERRARGVGFYAFSKDEDERQQQMKELLEMRSQTENKRAQHRTLKDKRREAIEVRRRLIAQRRQKSITSTVDDFLATIA